MASFRSDRTSRKPYSRPANTRAPDGQWLHDRAPGVPRQKAAPAPAPQPGTPNSKIVVSNLHYEITPKDLTAIFGQIGTLVREPLIRYDRSGRSSGKAIVSFENVAEAVRAKKQFDGILAKGQPMSIDFDTEKPRPIRRSSSAPNASLINRIQKPALLDRLAHDDSNIRPTPASGGVGPIRSKPLRAPRKKGPKKPPTAEDLDKELDAFMGDAASTPAADKDVEMA